MLKIYPLIIILLFPHLLFAQNKIPKGELVWSDDFDGSGIPDPAKWDRPQYNRRNNNKGPDGWWSNEDSYLDGEGNLVIRVRKINNKNGDDDPYDYSVGALRTKGKFEKLYGVFEIRCQLPTQKGWWIAFWMMQGNVGSEANGGVDGSEVDIMEGFGWTDKINQAIHWDGYADAHKSIGKKTDIDNLHEGFHTYTMVWNPDEYIFYIDGTETWRTQGGGVCNRPGYLKITGELSTESWAINDYWANDPEQATYPDHFMVDYVKVYELPSEEVPPIRELVEQCYPENNLVVGAACHAHYLGTQTEEILNREFSYVTPANDFKQSYIHPEPGKWNWERSDKWVNHCRENDQLLRLHAPISPQCSQWAKDDSRTPEELEQNLTEYMTMLCKRYNDSSHVKWLDVVNETVFHADGRWFGPEDGSDNWNNPWPRIGFDEAHELRPPLYIKKAFEIANEHGSNFKLIINQHGGMEPFIWDKIKSLVGYLRENNLRVDGIGWQAHIWMGWEKEAGNLERLSELIDWCHQNDLEFHITEFNVWLKPGDLDKLKEQANTFYAITKLAAEKQKNGFVGINYWHIRGIETQNKDRDGGPWAENYEPKEAYFRIKEAICEASPECRGECGPEKLSLVVDTFKIGSNKNLLAGEWESFSDQNSMDLLELDNQDGFEGTTCAKFKWTLKKGAVLYPYSMMQTWFDSEKKSIDLSDFHALKFDARGHGLVNVGMVTQNVDPDNYFFKTIALADEWKTFEIAISDLKQKDSGNTPFDIENVLSLLFGGNGDFNEPGEMWIDNIQLINEHAASEKEEPVPMVFHQPKINQTGYLLNSFKEFSVVADSVSAGESFFVINESGEEIYSGNLNSTPVDDSDISGEAVFKGDFSNLTTEGEFRIKVGNKTSFPFEINAAVYDSVLFNTLRAFYLMRANDEINDPITGLHHPGAHQSDATVSDGQGNLLDLTGGWYNDGSYGKYVPTTAFTCAHLMNLYEVNPGYFKNFNLEIPESNNDLPDILDEVKVGLNWLLKMQREDGAVYHKIDAEQDIAYGYGPSEDPFDRKIGTTNLSTIDAADFVAVAAQASRIFAPFDSVFSEKCKQAAIVSWDWIRSHPEIGQQDTFFTDPLSRQEKMWAKAEIFMITGDQGILGSFYGDLNTQFIERLSWKQPQLLSFAKLYNFPEIPEIVKNNIKLKLDGYVGELKTITDKSGYGSAIAQYKWDKGSNTIMSNQGAVFTYAHQVSGNSDWLNYASQQLDYIMGRNSLNYSFVTGYGENSCKQPFLWISKTFNIVPDGLLVNGAIGSHLMNSQEYDDQILSYMEGGFPSAKIYEDSIYFRNTNETGIYNLASFAYLTGYLSLYNREVGYSDSPLIQKTNLEALKINDNNNILYCTNCFGKTKIKLVSVNGQLLSENIVLAANYETFLIDYKKYVENYPIIIYNVTDDLGQMSNGKLTHF